MEPLDATKLLLAVNSDFVLSSFSAAARWGYCASDWGTVHVMSPVKGISCEPIENGIYPIIFTEQLFFDEKEVATTLTGLRYTGLFQSVMDMINSEQDWSRVDEVLDAFHEEGKLDSFVKYCQTHGLDKHKLDFALEGVFNG